MKKRLRKKLHRAEYLEIGMSVYIQTTEDDVQRVMTEITELANSLELGFAGGGLGYIIMPPNDVFGNRDVPTKIETLIDTLMKFPSIFPNFVMGYLQSKDGSSFSAEKNEAIMSWLQKQPLETKSNYPCDLWN